MLALSTMGLGAWIISYLANLALWLWVLLAGGAEWLEGTFTSGFLISSFAPRWSADGIKFFGWASLVTSTLVFLLGLLSPNWRALKFS
jgi:hypothetical protein